MRAVQAYLERVWGEAAVRFTLLAENSTIVISGAKIAQEIGVTRQQVWRWIQKLRELGVRVKGHPSSGYHLERTPDILVPQLLSHRLYGTSFARQCTWAKRGNHMAP